MKNKLIFKNVKYLSLHVLIVLIAFSGCDNSTAQQKKKKISKSENFKPKNINDLIAPDFSLADLDGNTVTLEQMRGRVVLLNFWFFYIL